MFQKNVERTRLLFDNDFGPFILFPLITYDISYKRVLPYLRTQVGDAVGRGHFEESGNGEERSQDLFKF